MDGEANDKEFSTRAIHVGTKHYEGSVNTPIFQSSTYKLTEETYAGWAAGAQHTLIYSRLSSVNSEAVAEKLASLENAEDGDCLLYTSPSPRDRTRSRMPSSA